MLLSVLLIDLGVELWLIVIRYIDHIHVIQNPPKKSKGIATTFPNHNISLLCVFANIK